MRFLLLTPFISVLGVTFCAGDIFKFLGVSTEELKLFQRGLRAFISHPDAENILTSDIVNMRTARRGYLGKEHDFSFRGEFNDTKTIVRHIKMFCKNLASAILNSKSLSNLLIERSYIYRSLDVPIEIVFLVMANPIIEVMLDQLNERSLNVKVPPRLTFTKLVFGMTALLSAPDEERFLGMTYLDKEELQGDLKVIKTLPLFKIANPYYHMRKNPRFINLFPNIGKKSTENIVDKLQVATRYLERHMSGIKNYTAEKTLEYAKKHLALAKLYRKFEKKTWLYIEHFLMRVNDDSRAEKMVWELTQNLQTHELVEPFLCFISSIPDQLLKWYKYTELEVESELRVIYKLICSLATKILGFLDYDYKGSLSLKFLESKPQLIYDSEEDLILTHKLESAGYEEILIEETKKS